MKILIYGLQSSGATSLAFLMSQRDNTIGVLDLFCDQVAPCLDEESKKFDIVVKATISEMFTIDQHIESFRPDVTILHHRKLSSVISSLSAKKHKDKCGKMENKIEIYKKLDKNRFNYQTNYEHLIDKQLGPLTFFVNESVWEFPRPLKSIIKFNCDNSDWCRTHIKNKWWTGCLRSHETGFKL